MKSVRLNTAAHRFEVHPRTILRALSNEVNVFWSEGFDPLLDVNMLADAYSMNYKVLMRIFHNTDTLLKPVAAAHELKVPPRTFRWRGYRAAARHGGIVRYSRSQIINEHLLKWDTEDKVLDI